MEYLIKQVRGRISGQENKEELGPSRDRIPPQKTTSFKGDKRRPQNWLRKQFSRQMSQNDDSSGIEYAAAVAAAAFAITSLRASSIPEKEKTKEEPKPSLTRTKTKKEEKLVSFSEPAGASAQFQGESSKTSPESPDRETKESSSDEKKAGKVVAPASSLKKAPSFTDKPGPTAPSPKKTITFTDKPTSPAPSIKKTPTSTDKPGPSMEKIPTSAEKDLNSTNEIKPEEVASQMRTPTRKTDLQSPTGPRVGETKADGWERVKLEKIKKRYAELNDRIVSWENKKKTKARRRLNKIEGEMEKTRLKALDKYRSEVENINQIAGGANAKAADRQRNEEQKVKAKANKIRETGNVPRTCFCF